MKEVGEADESESKQGITSSNFSAIKKNDKKKILASNNSIVPLETQSDFNKTKDGKGKRGYAKIDKVVIFT